MSLQSPRDFPVQNFSDSERSTDLSKIISLLSHWVWMILLVGVVMAGVAFFLSNQMTPVYESTTDLLVIDASADSAINYDELRAGEILAQTYSNMMVNDEILDNVIDQMSLDMDTKELKKSIEILPVRDTQIIKVSVEGADPEEIADIANNIVSEFINRIESIHSDRYASSIQSLSEQLSYIEGILTDINNQLDELDTIALTPIPNEDENETISPLQTERENLDAQKLQYQQIYANLLTSYEQARLSETEGSTNIIQINKALAPSEPIRPNVLLNTILAAMTAMVITIALLIIFDYFEDVIKMPTQIESELNLPVIGIIFEHKSTTGLISEEEPQSPISESFRSLRTYLEYCCVDNKIETLLITSPAMGTGKTLVSSNLAIMHADSGKKTILVDVDLRRPTVHEKLGIPNERGLTTALQNSDLPIKKIFYKHSVKNLSVLTSGPLPPNPSELLGSQRMRTIIENLKQESDIVIFDSTPILPVADATIMSTLVDAVVIILEPGVMKVNTAKLALKNLQRVNANLIGVVLNKAKIEHTGYSSYYQQYYGSKRS